METSYENKPYFFVPLADKADRRNALNKQNMLAGKNRAGKLNITIECMTPLHVGSGQLMYDVKSESFYHALLRENEQITIPGSSFKGMLRSIFEAVTPSCVLLAPRALPLKVGALSACNSNSGLCPACSLFGRLSYKGKLIFSPFYTDALPVIMKLPQLEQPFKTYPPTSGRERDPRTGNERLYYGNFRDVRGLDVAMMSKADFFRNKKMEPNSGGIFYGRKLYKHSRNWETLSNHSDEQNFECIPVKSVLNGSIIYQGLSDDELGAILFSLGIGWAPPIYHKCGYAKPAYLGSVKLDVTPEALPRYDDIHMTRDDAVDIALRYYKKNEPLIKNAVNTIKQEWSEIGDSKWVEQDGKYGY